MSEKLVQEYNWQSGLPDNWRDNEWKSGAERYFESISFQKYKDGRIQLLPEIEPYFQITEEGIVYNFHGGQSKVMASTKRFIIALASRQGGKSVSGPPWLLDEIMARGPGMYMAVAPSFPLLEDSALPRFMDLFDRGLGMGRLRHNPLRYEISPDGCEWLWPEGDKWAGKWRHVDTVIRFGHGSNPDSLEAKTVLGAWLDEAGQQEFKAQSFEAIEGRVTTTRGRVLMTTTPYNLGALYRKYYLPWLKANKNHPDIDVINWASIMNPAFPKEEYERLKSTMPAWKFDMFYNGLFTKPAGMIYDCFLDDSSNRSNVVDPFPIPPHWPRFLGMDFGGSNTAAVLCAQDPDTLIIYQYGEYLAGNAGPDEHKRRIEQPNEWSFDNGFWHRIFGGQASEGSVRESYRAEGLWIEDPPLKGAGSVEHGIDFVYSFVSKRLYRVFRSCENTLAQFNTYSREIDQETGDPIEGTIQDKEKFHYLDGVRYLLGGLARTSMEYEVALKEHDAGNVASYINRGQQQLRHSDRGRDPRYMGDFDWDDVIEGEVVELDSAGGYQLRNGIYTPTGMVALPSPFSDINSLPMPR